MLKFLLKIWPAFLPILVYIFWIYVIEDILIKKILRPKKIIDGEFKIVGEKSTEQNSQSETEKPKISKFSLQNSCFVTILYLSLSLAILGLIASAVGR
jgi:hypothetical protein